MKVEMMNQLEMASVAIVSLSRGVSIKMRRRPGFTLVELLVVVAVVGVLASLTLPTLSRAKTKAESVVCKNNLRQQAFALSASVNDSEGNYPGAHDPLISPEAPLVCPTAKRLMHRDLQRHYGYQYNFAGTGFWSAFDAEGVTMHYLGLGGSIRAARDKASVWVPLPETAVRMPSDMIAFTHFAKVGSGCEGTPRGPGFGLLPVSSHPSVGFGWPGVPGISSPDGPLHPGGENAAFCDGHVESEKSAGIPRQSGGQFKPDVAHARRWNYDHQPHPETWRQF